jgi:hypothetical protein
MPKVNPNNRVNSDGQKRRRFRPPVTRSVEIPLFAAELTFNEQAMTG